MNNLQQLFDFLFPAPRVVKAAHSYSKKDILNLYETNSYRDIYYLLAYQTPSIRNVITACKFHGDIHSAEILSHVVTQWLEEQSLSFTIIPIPLSRSRERDRGHNQVATILTHCTHLKKHTYCPDILQRTRDTIPQSSLRKNERVRNMKNAFAVSNNTSLTNQHVLLIDDVVTTGATLKTARAALTPLSPASITCLAIAH